MYTNHRRWEEHLAKAEEEQENLPPQVTAYPSTSEEVCRTY